MSQTAQDLDDEISRLKAQLAAQDERMSARDKHLTVLRQRLNSSMTGAPPSQPSASRTSRRSPKSRQPKPSAGSSRRPTSSSAALRDPSAFRFVSPTKKKYAHVRSRYLLPSPKYSSSSTTGTSFAGRASESQEVSVNDTMSVGSLPSDSRVVSPTMSSSRNRRRVSRLRSDEFRQQAQFMSERFRLFGPFIMNVLLRVFSEEEEEDGQESAISPSVVDRVAISKDALIQKLFLSNSVYEIAEKARWTDAMRRLLLRLRISSGNVLPEDLFFLPQISDYVLETLSSKCLHSVSLFKSLHPRLVILGPPESGKTLLLSVFARTMMNIALNETGEWSSILFFPMNWRLEIFVSTSVISFYHSIIEVTVRYIALQKPQLAPFRQHLASRFVNIVRESRVKTVSLPSSFCAMFHQEYLVLTILEKTIVRVFKNGDYDAFLRLTMSLPARFADIFGFARILYIFDNLDSTLVHLPNSNRDSTCSTSLLKVYIKEALENQSYVVTGKHMTRLFRTLQKETEDDESEESDFISISNIVHTDGIVDPEEVPELPESISLVDTAVYSDYRQSQMIPVECFKGCPAYLAHVLRFVGANPRAVRVSGSAPIPEEEATTILQNIISHEELIRPVRSQAYGVQKSKESIESTFARIN